MCSKKIPYDHRQPASEEVFVGRNSIVNRMADGLRSGYSYGLVGEVGIGKTSILFALKRKLTYGWFKEARPVPIPVYIELHEDYLTHEGAVFETILSKFVDALTEQHGLVVPDRENLLEEARKRRLEGAVDTLLDQYYKHYHYPCRLIILLDDLHWGVDHKALGEAVSVLRPLVSPKDRVINVSLVLSGESPLEREFRKDVSSLRGLLSDTVELAPLLPNDVATLVEVAEECGWLVEPGCKETVFALTRGYPFRLHYYLFTALHQYGKISQPILQSISKDHDAQNFLDTMLKQTPIKQEWKRMSKTVKILFLAANPLDTRRLRLDEEIEEIDKALRQAEFGNRFDIKQHGAVSVDDLQGYLLRHKPDIVHFSGHGSPSSQIILEDKSGNGHPVSPYALSHVFSILKDNIQCVVLNACYTELQARAIAQHIDCVIGMSKLIGDTAAISFAKAFYQALGYGKSVKTAFDSGCAQIDLNNLGEQDTPKLLTINSDSANITFVNDNA